MSRVAVVLHERLGTWAGQLRPRLHDRPVRWFETRSSADLESVLNGLACPVVLIDLGKNPAGGLEDLDRVAQFAPEALVLVLNPEGYAGLDELARELGATHLVSGFVPPPEVAELIDRWIALAGRQLEREGWSRPLPAQSPRLDPWNWHEAILNGSETGEANSHSNLCSTTAGLDAETDRSGQPPEFPPS